MKGSILEGFSEKKQEGRELEKGGGGEDNLSPWIKIF